MGASTLVGHSSLITKVYFPRELLPLSMTAANLVNMLIAYAIFLPYAIWVRGISIPALVLLIPISVAFFVFTAAIAMLLSAAMVYFRDVEFLIGIALTAWFYVVPVIYSFDNIKNATLRQWMERDPVVPFINAYRDAVFYKETVSVSGMIAALPDRARRLGRLLRGVQPAQGAGRGGAVNERSADPRSPSRASASTSASTGAARRPSRRRSLSRRRGVYEEFTAVDDVSFEVPTGEALGIFGRNGSGKSTMLKMLARILSPDAGHDRGQGSRRRAARGRRGLPPRVLRDREHLPERRDLRHVARRSWRRGSTTSSRSRSSSGSPTTRSRRTRAACTRVSASRSPSTSTRTCCWSTRCSPSVTRASARAATSACSRSARPARR